MKTILIVDDNIKVVTTISRILNAYQDLFVVMTARDGQSAIDLLNNEKIDLVLTELNLPTVNGIALIKHVLNSGFEIPIIVMTAYGTPEIELKLNSIPRIAYFNKPLKMDAVIETIFEKLEQPFGQVGGVGLSSFLQLLELEGKTCTLTVISKDNHIGAFYFLDGDLIGAKSENNQKEAAAHEMLKWKDVKIHIVYSISKQDREITQSLMNILMEGAKLEDEDEKDDVPSEISEPPAAEKEIDKTKGLTAKELMESGPLADTLGKMKAALREVMGPHADNVFMTCLNLWAETIEPSEASVPSLIDLLDHEIQDPEKVARYRSIIDS